MSNLFSFLSKEDHLVGLKRRGQRRLVNQQVGELVSPNSVGAVVKQDTIKEVVRVRLEETLPYQAPQTEPQQLKR